MPAYNREQKRIAALMAGDTEANFGTWIPEEERNQQDSVIRNPAIYNQQGSQNASRAILGERPMLGDALKPSNNYQDAIRRRLAGINGLSETANASAFAAANARAQANAQINLPDAYTGNTGSKYTSNGSLTDGRNAVLAAAARSVGLPYSWGGGNSKGASYGLSGSGERHNSSKIYGFDCSGLVQYAYAQAGIKLPRGANGQALQGVKTSINKLVPGDLVGKPGHIAIYAGNGMMYEAPTFGKKVRLVPVRSGMFGVHFKF